MLLLRDLMLNGQNSSPKACELDEIMDQPLFLINPAAQEEPKPPAGSAIFKSGKAQREHMFSALPPEADIRRTGRDVRVVP
jgi:hypothetical protein